MTKYSGCDTITSPRRTSLLCPPSYSFRRYYKTKKLLTSIESIDCKIQIKQNKSHRCPQYSRKAHTIISSQGISHEQLNSRAAWVMDKCREHGFHYSDRIHIRVYGNRNGV